MIEIKQNFVLPSNPNRFVEGGLRLRHAAGDGDASPRKGNKQPLISMVTIVLNGSKTIEKTIRSVLEQTYQNIEYIIVDGGSTDGTQEIIKQYEHSLGYWVSEPDNGISDAFNKGLSLAQGKLVGIINADDWLEPDAVESVISVIETVTEYVVVYGKLQLWRDRKKAEMISADHKLLQRDMTMNHPAVFASVNLYHKIGGFDDNLRYAMDYDWLWRARTFGAAFIYIDKCLANMSLAGISDRQWKKTIREVRQVKIRHSGSIMGPWLSFGLHLIRANIRRMLEASGLGILVHLYHSHLSHVPKIEPRDL